MMRWATVLGWVSLAGCAGYEDSALMSGAGGATVGGTQDIGYARELIANGQVPLSEHIRVEGLLSEHHVPPPSTRCEDLFCLSPALGLAPSLDTGEQATWVHLGLTSVVTVEARPPVDLVVVVDRSAEMGIDMRETASAVVRLAEQLSPEDRLAVLGFADNVDTAHAFGPPDVPTLRVTIDAWQAAGGWDLEPAMSLAYDTLAEAGNDPSRLRRVILVTCGYPESRPNSTFNLGIQTAAKDRIGVTVVGILLGWDPNLGELLGDTRGGNQFYTSDLASTETVFDDDLDSMITPLAYDLEMQLQLDERYRVAEVYGLPAEQAPSVDLSVKTVFASRRGGALFARLERDGDADEPAVGSVTLAYDPESAHGLGGGSPSETPLVGPDVPPVSDGWFASPGVRKGVALITMAEAMQLACDAHHGGGSIAEAQDALAFARLQLVGARDALGDADLDPEIALIDALSALL